MVYNFFYKKSKGSNIANNEIKQKLKNCTNQSLETLKKEELILDLKTIFWALIQLICNHSYFDKIIKYLLCAIDLFHKYAWVISIKDKKGIAITNSKNIVRI